MKKQEKIEAKFDEMIAEVNVDEAIPYVMTNSFNIDDIIMHPQFGIGKVLSFISPNKMQVVFRECEKIMICVLQNENDVWLL